MLRATHIMDTFEGGDHGVDVASTLNRTVDAAIGHLDKHLESIIEQWVLSYLKIELREKSLLRDMNNSPLARA